MMNSARIRRAFAASILPLAALSSAACSGKKNTEIVVAIQTDLRVPKDLNAITLRVISRGAVQYQESHVVGPTGLHLPGTIGLVPDNADDLQPIEVQVVGQWSEEPDPRLRKERVLRKLRVTFAKGRVGLVRIPLKFACYDVTGCKEAESCLGGVCVPTPLIEGATLPEYTPEEVFGPGGSEGNLAVCWDGAKCLAPARPIAPTADSCVFSLAGGGSFATFDPARPITIALTTSNGLGYCDSGTCRVALEEDELEGFTWTDGTKTQIRLAPGLCTRVRDGKGSIVVQATDACEAKTAKTPYCESFVSADGGAIDTMPTDWGTPDSMIVDASVDSTLDATVEASADSSVEDSTVADTSVVDSAAPDATVTDTGVADTGVAEDTSVADTSVADSTVADSTVADTGVADSTVADTSVPDASVVDTSVADTATIDSTATDAGAPDTFVMDTAVPPDTGAGPTDGCIPSTCGSLGASCGSPSDGCGGTLFCGSCDVGTCGSSYTCECLPLTVCPSPANCGSLDDGCGGFVPCGVCTAPEWCGGGGTANECGMPPDGGSDADMSDAGPPPDTGTASADTG